MRDAVADVVLPVAALACALLLFGVFVWLGGASPVETWALLFKGAFGDWFSWQNTLSRAAPLMLAALCVALPARGPRHHRRRGRAGARRSGRGRAAVCG